jgi:glutathione synthase
MRLVFVIDPIETLDPQVDTSLGLTRAALCRGAQVWTTETTRLEAVDGRARALARPYPNGDPGRLWLDEAAAVFMRTEPPMDEAYVTATLVLDLVDPAKTVLVNDPRGLRACSEHVFPLRFPDLTPPTIVTADRHAIVSFLEDQKVAVVKPVDGYAGRGVFRLELGDPNLPSLLEATTAHGARAVVVQAFLPEVADGNKRIFVVDGEPVGAVYRYPAEGDFRIGAPAAPAALSTRDREICARLAPSLRANGLRMAGLDVIGEHLIEVNLTSPGALRKADLLLGTTYCADLLEALL